jgi:hypothetical protein
MAFGNKTVHCDLRLLYPLSRPFEPRRSHCYSVRQSEYRHRCDKLQPRQWKWRGANCDLWERWIDQCRRWKDMGSVPEEAPWRFLASLTPTIDYCGNEIVHRAGCPNWPAGGFKKPHSHSIGIMGFLLSCRAAYIEGTDVLYGTCHFLLAGAFLFRNLREVLLPERVAMITSIGLMWDLRISAEDPDHARRPRRFSIQGVADQQPPDITGRDDYGSLLESIPDMLPNLKRLCISLTGDVVPEDVLVKEDAQITVAKMLLEPVENVLRKMGLRNCCVMRVPKGVYDVFNPSRDSGDSDSDSDGFDQNRDSSYSQYFQRQTMKALQRRFSPPDEESEPYKLWLCTSYWEGSCGKTARRDPCTGKKPRFRDWELDKI